MQPYDFVMLFVLGGLTIYGYAKGMAWQVAYLTSFIASYFVATQFSGQLAPVFGDTAPWNKFVAMAAIYAGFSLITWMVFRAVKGGINKVKLQSFDRQMGAFVGAARGALWCLGITFFAVTLLPDNVKQNIIASQSGRYIAKFLDRASAVVPPEVHEVIGPHLARLEQELNQGQPSAGGFQPQQPFGGAFGGGQPGNAPSGWPQQPSNPASGWPASPQPSAAQPSGGWPTTGAWPAASQPQPTNGGTPARPAAWPNQPQPTNPWANR
ncbi:MAG: CvpA family protein [Planctomycetota bacterium]